MTVQFNQCVRAAQRKSENSIYNEKRNVVQREDKFCFCDSNIQFGCVTAEAKFIFIVQSEEKVIFDCVLLFYVCMCHKCQRHVNRIDATLADQIDRATTKRIETLESIEQKIIIKNIYAIRITV